MLDPNKDTKNTVKSSEEDLVKDVTLSNFMREVVEASRKKLVIMDFWAPWCGPCKQLGPVLEKLVRAHKGAMTLAKINVDQNPEIAQQMRVQSIPAVFAVFQGQPIDGFVGALPETQIKTWLEKLLKALGPRLPHDVEPDADSVLKQAEELLTAGEIDAAHAIYTEILEEIPDNAEAFVGVLRCLIAQGKIHEARNMLDAVPPGIAGNKALGGVRTAIELAEEAEKVRQEAGSLDDLMMQVQSDPRNHQARFNLSLALYAAGKHEQAIDELLEIVRRDRKWNEEAARKQLVKIFDSLGPTDPLTAAARKKLSAILFS